MSDLNEVDARQRAEASETMLSYFETSNWLEFWENQQLAGILGEASKGDAKKND